MTLAALAPLQQAVAARAGLLDAAHQGGWRLFNGFLEGDPALVIDVYGRTLVVHNYADPPAAAESLVQAAVTWLCDQFPWLQAAVLKPRQAPSSAARRGVLLFGPAPDRKLCEDGVWYALDLLFSRDASFYLDTRGLRQWARQALTGKRVLNTFAYTGSLGVAACAGGAAQVVHLDQNRACLNLAKTSYTLNGFPIHKTDFLVNDFWKTAGALRRSGAQFDCVFVDPPFFAAAATGVVDLVNAGQRVLNKVRPLVADGGWLVAINNALFVSGADYLHTLQSLCADGYLSIEQLIPVPADITGYPATRQGQLPADPAPFNHATKIALLRVRRKAFH
jgi:23S rRNA (cytosine1962-C5)-methyltransferase